MKKQIRFKKQFLLVFFLVVLFSLPSVYAISIGESYELLTYSHKAEIHYYYNFLWIAIIMLIMLTFTKKHPIIFIFIPLVALVLFNLSFIALIFSSDFLVFDYKNQNYVAEVSLSSPSRVHFIDIYEFDGRHKSEKPFISGWIKGDFDTNNPFEINAPTCYISDKKVDCSYYGIPTNEF